ncbi:SMP-30/gluconolactonase/LRE family protein [Streptomyces sp. NPDC090025]|uniref:SMP-30/gluconolactonase/LRE family protein n=1 Tax=Streptomyces sp. NPDC090025 TaxID=3365922 RepID=UPI00383774D3
MSRSLARRGFLGAAAALGATALTAPLTGVAQAATAERALWPESFPLPNGFAPEGITIGCSPYAYFGSLTNGAVHRVSLATGRGRTLHQGLGDGHSTVGLKIDHAERRLFLAGGFSREIRVVDARKGTIVRNYTGIGAENTMVNDVVLTPKAAWFTDSFQPQLYRLSLNRNGDPVGSPVTVPLVGAWQQGGDFTANGIARTPDGRALLVVNTSQDGGVLTRVDTATGAATVVDHGDLRLPYGDGLLLVGNDLYVVQQQLNQIDVIRLNAAGTQGTAVGRITDPRFRIPTTAAAWDDRIYLPNARFDVDPTPTTDYDAVAIAQL